jgi:signal transduction histidine kinase
MSGDSELTVEGLAHDLNNIFETLSDAADLLGTDSKWTKLASTIRRSVRRGERIVASLSETISEQGDLGDILDNAIQHTEDVLTFTGGTAIQYTRQFSQPVTLPGCPAAWERVFVNLFLNAVQANPLGTEVAIGATCESAVVTLTVTDNGPGIPASILPTIFEPNVTTKKSRGRRGLGLHIVQSIVTEHGGTVTAQNQQPRGAIFTMTLPQGGVS